MSSVASGAQPPARLPVKQSGAAKVSRPAPRDRPAAAGDAGATQQAPNGAPPPASEGGNNQRATISVTDGAGVTYRLRNLDVTARGVTDLQHIVAVYTKASAGLHSFYLRGVHLASRRASLWDLGVRDGVVLHMRVRSQLTVVAPSHSGAEEIEMRMHNLDLGAATFGELRMKVDARTRYPYPFVMKVNPVEYVTAKADHIALGAAGVREGDTLMVIPSHALGYETHKGLRELQFVDADAAPGAPQRSALTTPASAAAGPIAHASAVSGVGGGVGASAVSASMVSTASPAHQGGASPSTHGSPGGRSVHGAHVSRWPVPKDYLQLGVIADGVWAVGAAIGTSPVTARLPLPPLRADTTVGELRRVIFDMLGVVPECQVLSEDLRGEGLPVYGSNESTCITEYVPPGAAVRVAVDERVARHPSGSYYAWCDPDAATARTPWCVHCVVADMRGAARDTDIATAEWRPIFAQPSWTVDQLLSLVAMEAQADAKHCSLHFRGLQMSGRAGGATIEAAGVREGACVLVLLRSTVDLTVHVQLTDGRVFQTFLRGVPPRALPVEVAYKALASHGIPVPPSEFIVAADGERLPQDAPLEVCGITSSSIVTCVQRGDAGGAQMSVARGSDLHDASGAPHASGPFIIRTVHPPLSTRRGDYHGSTMPPPRAKTPTRTGGGGYVTKGAEDGRRTKLFPTAPASPGHPGGYAAKHPPKPQGVRWPPPPVQP